MQEIWTMFVKNAGEIAASWTRTNKKFGVAVAQKEQHYLETSKIRSHVLHYFSDGKGIDVGCSRDPLTRTCVAFDQSDWPEVTHRGDARALPFGDAEFDWLWSSHLLEHFEDTAAVLKEWVRVLKPGGTIGLYVPHPELYKGGNPDHKHPGFKPEFLVEQLATLSCFEVESFIHDVPTGPYPCYSTLVIARKA
jgi:SAM-dependent methyltransferase